MEEDGSGSGWMAIWYLYEKFDPGRQGQSNLKNSKFHFLNFIRILNRFYNGWVSLRSHSLARPSNKGLTLAQTSL